MMENFQISMESYIKNLFILLLLLIVINSIVLLYIIFFIYFKHNYNKKLKYSKISRKNRTKLEEETMFEKVKERIIKKKVKNLKNNLTNLKNAEIAFKKLNNKQKISGKNLHELAILARKLDTNVKKQYKKDTKIKQNQTFKKLDEDLKKIIKIRNKKNKKNNEKTKTSNNLNKKEDKIKNDILAISAAKKDIEMKQFENKEIKDKIADI